MARMVSTEPVLYRTMRLRRHPFSILTSSEPISSLSFRLYLEQPQKRSNQYLMTSFLNMSRDLRAKERASFISLREGRKSKVRRSSFLGHRGLPIPNRRHAPCLLIHSYHSSRVHTVE